MNSWEQYAKQLENNQRGIEDINDQILLLQMQRERYEQIGHAIVALMYGENHENRTI